MPQAKKTPIPQANARKPFLTALVILAVLFFASVLIASIIIGFSGDGNFGNVALIPIKGEITADSQGGLFSASTAGSSDITDQLATARDDGEVKAVLLEINSPGGSAVASAEIAQAVKDVRAANKTVVAWIREEGASGAYWVASSSSHIVANPVTITGSVGVISSYLDFAGLMANYNVSYERLVAGDYKDMGTPYRHLTPQETALFQQKLDKVQEVFLDDVAKNRNLSASERQEISSGVFYLGSEAKDLHLVDELGGKQEAINYLEKAISENVTLKHYSTSHSLLDVLNNALNEKSFYMGQGIASKILSQSQSIAIQAK